MIKVDAAMLEKAIEIQQHCRDIGAANLGGDCCKGCVFWQDGCMFKICPEEWRLNDKKTAWPDGVSGLSLYSFDDCSRSGAPEAG